MSAYMRVLNIWQVYNRVSANVCARLDFQIRLPPRLRDARESSKISNHADCQRRAFSVTSRFWRIRVHAWASMLITCLQQKKRVKELQRASAQSAAELTQKCDLLVDLVRGCQTLAQGASSVLHDSGPASSFP